MGLHVVELTDLVCVGRMAVGLGATPEEWEELKGNVDDSFWVMRVIGSLVSPPLLVFVIKRCMTGPGYPPLQNDHDGFSCGAHKSVSMFHLSNNRHLIAHSILRDYGCLTYGLPQCWVYNLKVV